nr:cmp-sialic acid transporter 4 [Quercus suber]
MEYIKLNVNDQDENGNGRNALSVTNNVPTLGGTTIDWSKWKLKIILIVALALLMSSQSIVIVWSKRNGKDIIVETLKCGLSLLALARIWRSEGVTEDNRLSTTLDEVIVTHSCITLPSQKSGSG